MKITLSTDDDNHLFIDDAGDSTGREVEVDAATRDRWQAAIDSFWNTQAEMREAFALSH